MENSTNHRIVAFWKYRAVNRPMSLSLE
uniref:Uncharacterized protein n=1 Tax=Anguilla anguilla TaxID=7936 RepID=A0A0E9S850_ANGAN